MMVTNEHSLVQKVMSADKRFTPTVMLKVQDRQDARGRDRTKARLYLDTNALERSENQ